MSYRLINSNVIAIKYPEVNDMPCVFADLEDGLHGQFIEERKKGKWMPVMNGRGGHCCNRCNGYAPSYANGDEHLSDYCPNCGAKMELVLNIM